MQYMGGKARIAKRIVQAILDDGAPTELWVEPFVGGGNVMEHAAPRFSSSLGMDAHPDLILMWQAAVAGWEPPEITRELYAQLRNAEPSALRGFAGFGASFGGKWFGGYGVSPRDGELWPTSLRALVRQGAVFQSHGTRFEREDFGEWTPPPGTTVYCDPPYAGTTGYATGEFDHDAFYKTLVEWAWGGAHVYVSEYAIPDWVPGRVVWTRERRNALKSTDNTRVATEILFRVASERYPVEGGGAMPEKKEAECCGRRLAHKKDGRPYEHACHREGLRPDDEFEVPGKQRPQTKPGTKSPWLGPDDGCKCSRRPRKYHDSACPCHPEGPRPTDDDSADEREQTTPPAPVSKELAVPDPWEDAAPAAPIVPEVNVSGQPKARYEWRGSTNLGYLTKDPATGDFKRYKNGKPKGFTRVTTFVKAASDSTALTDWAKRNVLIGASKRPDVVARAHGLTHADNRGDLMSLVGELETAAGAKVSADIGTMIHEFTERADGDPEFELASIPAQFRPAIELYRRTVAAAGLIPVAGLIERTTHVSDFGGVAGTWDRVYFHQRSGQYVIGDVKTGKTLEYGMAEIEAQEAIYARGANTSGAYDWNTDTWRTLKHATTQPGERENLTVSEDWGVVVHMPVQGPDAGKCLLVKADLQRGWQWAWLCHDVRTSRAAKPKPEAWTGAELDALETGAEGQDWDAEFSSVQDVDDAGAAWEAARAAGITGLELNRLVSLAQQRLRELGITG